MNEKFNPFSIMIFIIINAIFFYFGTTVNEPSSNLIKVLLNISQFLASIATVVAVLFAYKSSKVWINQITHADKHKEDKDLINKLNVIHESCYQFSCMRGFRIDSIINEYIEAMKQEDTHEATYLVEEWRATKKAHIELADRKILAKFRTEILWKASGIFGSPKDIPTVLNQYDAALCQYVRSTSRICTVPLSKATIKTLQTNNFTIGTTDIAEIGINGQYFAQLDHAYNEVKEYYKNKWS